MNFVIPGRRERLISEIMRMDQEAGLYEDWDEDHAHDMVLNSMLSDLSEEDIQEIIDASQTKPELNENLNQASERYKN